MERSCIPQCSTCLIINCMKRCSRVVRDRAQHVGVSFELRSFHVFKKTKQCTHTEEEKHDRVGSPKLLWDFIVMQIVGLLCKATICLCHKNSCICICIMIYAKQPKVAVKCGCCSHLYSSYVYEYTRLPTKHVKY